MNKLLYLLLACTLAASNIPAHGMSKLSRQLLTAASKGRSRLAGAALRQQKAVNPALAKRAAVGVIALSGVALGYEQASAQARTTTLKDKLKQLPDSDPEKITAQQDLLDYIRSAESTNAIDNLCGAVYAHYDLFSKTIDIGQLKNKTENNDIPPTLAHMYTTPNPCNSEYVKQFRLNNIVKKVVELEKECLQEKETHYSYVHAHRWEFDLVQKIYAELYPQKNKEFFPLHFMTLINTPSDESWLIRGLQKRGATRETAQEKYLLSVNAAFFGNSRDSGESTAHYFLNNRSVRPPNLSLVRFFTHFDKEGLYAKYESEFDELEKLHRNCSDFGKLWVIKVPKNVHSRVIIPTKPYGIKTEFLIDGKKTDNVDFIQDTLRTCPQSIDEVDDIQFRMLMTPSTGLNPDLGIKTIPLHCADPIRYAEFETKFNALMTKVKTDIAAQENKSIISRVRSLFS